MNAQRGFLARADAFPELLRPATAFWHPSPPLTAYEVVKVWTCGGCMPSVASLQLTGVACRGIPVSCRADDPVHADAAATPAGCHSAALCRSIGGAAGPERVRLPLLLSEETASTAHARCDC
jgi:hypothetical protein